MLVSSVLLPFPLLVLIVDLQQQHQNGYALLLLASIAAVAFVYWLTSWPGRRVATIRLQRAPQWDDAQTLWKTTRQRGKTSAGQQKELSFDTIVIGTGAGGSSCANLLAQAGQKVLVLEQHPNRTGGCTHNCEWDTGLHYTSAAMACPTRRAGALIRFMTGGQQEWRRLEDPYDHIFFPKEDEDNSKGHYNDYEFHTGYDSVIEHVMSRIATGDPNDPKNLQLKRQCQVWMQLCQRVNEDFSALGFQRLLPTWLHFLVKHRVAELYRLAAMTVREVQYAVFDLNYSLQDLLRCHHIPAVPPQAELAKDPVLRKLKAVLNHPIGDYAVQPREATIVAQAITMAHYSQGAAYTVGPTQNLSIRQLNMVEQMPGCQVYCNATVDSIMIEHHDKKGSGRACGVRVRPTVNDNDALPSLTEIRAKNIVCATTVFNLYHKLLPQDLPATRDFMDVPKQRTITPSNGHVFLFCKLSGTAEELNLPKHNLWYINSYDIDNAFDQYNAAPTKVRPATVYIGFPCTKDPTWKKRYPKCCNCILISDGQWGWFAKWQGTTVGQRGQDYEQFKEQLTQHLLDILYESVPQVEGKVEYHTLGTPLTDVSYLDSYHGGSYGTKCDVNIFNELNAKWTTTPFTPVPGLYMAGADAFLPAVCGAMYGGVLSACAVLGPLSRLRLALAFVAYFADALRAANPKLTRPRAWALAVYKIVTESVAN